MSKFKLIVGGDDSLVEAMKNIANEGKFKIVPSRKKCMYVIADRNDISAINEIDDNDKQEKFLFNSAGNGTIMFSTDVNSLELSKNSFKNKIMQIYETYKNRVFSSKILDKIRRKHKT